LKALHENALENQIAAHEAELEERETVLMNDFMQQSSRMNDDMKARKTELEERDATIGLVRRESFSLQTGMEASNKEVNLLKADIATRDAAIEAKCKQVSDLEGDVAARDDTIQAAIEQVASFKAVIESKDEKIASAAEESNALKADVATRDDAISAAKKEVASLKADIAVHGATIEAAKTKAKSLNATIIRRDESIASLEKELASLAVDVEERDASIANLNEEVRLLTADIVSRDEEIDGITEELVQACSEIAELESVHDLEKEVGHRSLRRVADSAARHIYEAYGGDEYNTNPRRGKHWSGTDLRNSLLPPKKKIPDSVEHQANAVLLSELRSPRNKETKRLGPAPDLFYKAEPDKNIYDRLRNPKYFPVSTQFHLLKKAEDAQAREAKSEGGIRGSRRGNRATPATGTGSIFDRLADPKTFTGTHAHRFDADGVGLGLEGRMEDVSTAKAIKGETPITRPLDYDIDAPHRPYYSADPEFKKMILTEAELGVYHDDDEDYHDGD